MFIKRYLVALFAFIASMFGTAVAFAQANPLITAATTETASAKTDLLTTAGLLFVVTLALWGAYKIIRMFGSR